jgi:hypothetical protein
VSDFNENLIFSIDFREITQIYFMKIRSVRALLLNAARRTDKHDEADWQSALQQQ